jgi:protein AFG1
MLMDLFYHTLPHNIKRKRRVHFHAFMVDVHKRLHAAKLALGLEGGDPISPVARDLANDASVLCFDEFQVRVGSKFLTSCLTRLNSGNGYR